MKTSRSGRVMAATIAALAIGGPVAPASPADAGSLTRTKVTTAGPVGDLDELTVSAESGSAQASGPISGSPKACLIAQLTQSRTEIREGQEVQVKVVTRETGCAETSVTYTFDHLLWSAELAVQVPTTVKTTTSELRGGAWVVTTTASTAATAELDLKWSGVGDPTPEWGADAKVCYRLILPVCAAATVGASRPATVAGTLLLGSIGGDVALPANHPGTMRWWDSARI